jgi:hypothetical protein
MTKPDAILRNWGWPRQQCDSTQGAWSHEQKDAADDVAEGHRMRRFGQGAQLLKRVRQYDGQLKSQQRRV